MHGIIYTCTYKQHTVSRLCVKKQFTSLKIGVLLLELNYMYNKIEKPKVTEEHLPKKKPQKKNLFMFNYLRTKKTPHTIKIKRTGWLWPFLYCVNLLKKKSSV